MVDDRSMPVQSDHVMVAQQPLGGKARFGGQRSGKWKCGPLGLMVHQMSFESILTYKFR